MCTFTLLRCIRVLFVVALAVTTAVQTTRAADDDPAWTVRFDVAWADPSGDFEATATGAGTLETSFDSGFGAGLRGEYQFSPRFGLDLGVLSVGSVDISAGVVGGTTGSNLEVSSFTPVTVGLNVHLTPDRPLDLYVGPVLAWVSYSGLDIRTAIATAGSSVSVDDDVGFGAIIGLDVPLGEWGWLIQANLRFIATDISNSGVAVTIDSKFDPLIVSVGFGYRF